MNLRLIPVLVATCGVIALGTGPAAGQSDGPTCFGQPATIVYPDTQFIVGTSRDDVIVADSRPQLIDGREGNDLICGGGGKDVIGGGPGDDSIAGEGGRDNLGGNAGNDRLFGGRGRDLLKGMGGRDRCAGGPQADFADPKTCEVVRSAITKL
jgi:RTX calcium-binding nonapeptide repeat (4 copies)